MRLTWLVLALGACGACDDTWRKWDDVPGAVATPVALDVSLPAWTRRVQSEVDVWRAALDAIGCPAPFTVGPGGHPVELVDPSAWTLSAKGNTDGTSIRILGWSPGAIHDSPVLLHELGHALGLSHADPKFGPSLMTAHVDQAAPLPRDIAAAACSLGCGPCDPSADPYTLP